MAIGLGIGLHKFKLVSSGAFSGITVIGQYDSVESANLDGASPSDFFVTTQDNVYGLPEGILIRIPPFDSYISAAAGAEAVGPNVVFQLSQGNVHGWPVGTCMITSPKSAFNNDTEASIAGVQVGGLYALNSPNFGKLIKQRLA